MHLPTLVLCELRAHRSTKGYLFHLKLGLSSLKAQYEKHRQPSDFLRIEAWTFQAQGCQSEASGRGEALSSRIVRRPQKEGVSLLAETENN